MASLLGSWRTPDQGSLASSRLGSGLGKADFYRHLGHKVEKRPFGDDTRSVASKFSQSTYNSRSTVRNSRRREQITCNIGSIDRNDFFKPGTIAVAHFLEEAFENSSVVASDESIIRVPGHPDISDKRRLFIILAEYAQTYVSVPIFSHQGKGTKHKPKPEEYVSLQDHRATYEVSPQSMHEPLMTLEMSGNILTPASVAHLAYPVTRRYITPVTIIGRLAPSSTNRLIRLFRTYTPVEIREAMPGSSTDVLIHAEMSISNALIKLQFLRYAPLLGDMSWVEAANLRDSDLKARGIASVTDRQRLLSLFEQVETAYTAGPGWNTKVSKASLTTL